MSDRNSKDWRDCHVLAARLTSETCFEFTPQGQSSAVGARMKRDRARVYGHAGLDFDCRVIRYSGSDGHLMARGQRELRFEVSGRGWLESLVDAFAVLIDEAATKWAKAAAIMLESDAAPHAHRLLEVSLFSYRRHMLPPGWSSHDLVQHQRSDEPRLPDLTVEQAWLEHREFHDPPGYVVKRDGLDRGRPLFTAAWAGMDADGPTTPKERAGCRADMWRDFDLNERAAILDQLTRGPEQ